MAYAVALIASSLSGASAWMALDADIKILELEANAECGIEGDGYRPLCSGERSWEHVIYASNHNRDEGNPKSRKGWNEGSGEGAKRYLKENQ